MTNATRTRVGELLFWPAGLVAEELVGAAAEADPGDAEDGGQDEKDGVPVDHGACPAGRVGEVLSGPEGYQRSDDDALEADDKEELATAAAAVESFDLLRGQVAFLDGDEHVGHGAVVSCWSGLHISRSLARLRY